MATAMDVDLGWELKTTRMRSKLSQKQVAEHLTLTLGHKVSRPLVSRWESNKSTPGVDDWLEMMRLFASRGASTQAMTISTWKTASPRATAVAA